MLVNHGRTGAQLGEVAHGQLVVVGCLGAATGLAHDFAVELGFGDDRDSGIAQPEPFVQRPLGDRERLAAIQKVLPAVDVGDIPMQRRECFIQRFAAPAGLGDEQNAQIPVSLEKRLQRRQRALGAGVDRDRRR